MSNCTGYSFDVSINLCAQDPLGDGGSSDLNLNISTGFMWGSTVIPAWDGKELVIDLIADPNITVVDFNTDDDRCDVEGAVITLIPDDVNTNTGMALLEITVNNCDGPPMTTSPILGASTSTTTTPAPDQYVDENCGGSGPHVLSEMIPITLDTSAGCT